jgi:ABC-type antimicrobial peptide transport system permease subunit
LILGLVGVLLGSAAGVGVGVVLLALGGGLGPVAGVPWLPVELAAALGLVLPVIAALYPARLAARVTILTALQFE